MKPAFVFVLLCLPVMPAIGQGVHAVPRPPAQTGGAPANESATPDGYAPIPAWSAQTRAPRPDKVAAYSVETVAEGLMGAFSFNFLPDGRILVAERAGHMKLVGKDGKISEIEGLPANLWARGQGLFEARPDRAFASNRTIYFAYTALPDGANTAALPRSPGVLLVARAKLSPDDKKLEDVRVLLNAEGTLGRVIQAPDGTLLATASIPAGLGINSVDWPQPQALDR